MKTIYLLTIIFSISIIYGYGNYDNRPRPKTESKKQILSRSKSTGKSYVKSHISLINQQKKLKKGDVTIYALDSVAFFATGDEFFGYEQYYYDNDYLSTMFFYYLIDFPNEYLLFEKEFYENDENGNVTSYTKYILDENTEKFVGNAKETMVYDANGREIEWVQYNWNGYIDDWNRLKKGLSGYDSADHVVEWLEYSWDAMNEKWELSFKDSNIYVNDLRVRWVSYELQNEIWIRNFEEYFEYDSLDRLIEWRSQYLDNNKDEWVFEYKDNYTYDNEDNLEKIIKYSWNDDNSTWQGDEKVEITYQEKDDLYEDIETVYLFDVEGNFWVPYIKISRVYDEYFLLTNNYYDWDIDAKDWVLYIGADYYYDDVSKLVLSQKTNNIEQSISIFPNPAKELLNIELGSSLYYNSKKVDFQI